MYAVKLSNIEKKKNYAKSRHTKISHLFGTFVEKTWQMVMANKYVIYIFICPRMNQISNANCSSSNWSVMKLGR